MKQILSPLPGTFYRKPSPEAPAYKSEGDSVAVGDVVGLIEVMKSFHEVKSEAEGKIKAFAIENEDPVTAGQVLAELED
ncbi:biotin carboxyl carrier domain-containing protein [Pelagibius litoralis]|uniref:Biotin carboxyl carrier protein of acetyl-CoA carboxylase n=1 Tax=Pelagibius litoralis TaxID=374515 RepID=A0A967F068_9PROT|nr:acetyl-CoA carboxylase [Pelagibius litoralis]NIA70607.1 biotin carboxyl carrier domain-containing protein [Pelagibius litoralis]